MLLKLLSTNNSLAMLWVRLPVGIAMVVHAWGKVINVPGFVQYCDNLGIPPVLAYCAIAAEFFGGLGMIFGCLTRVAASAVGFTMLVAALLRHVNPGYGYLMNWHAGTPWGAEGYEYHTFIIGMSLGVIFAGAGALSIDHVWAKWLAQARERGHVPAAVSAGARVHGD